MEIPEDTNLDTVELAEVAYNALDQLHRRQIDELRHILWKMDATVGTSPTGIENWNKICELIRELLTTVVKMDRIKRFNVQLTKLRTLIQ